jgi:hypothetical protein
MARKTAVVRPDNTAEFVCTSCGETHIITVERPLRSSTPVRTRIRCQCGSSHAVFLERRAYVRKEVALRGSFRLLDDDRERAMTVRNLSRTGLLFEPDDDDPLAVDDRVMVDFTFGNQLITRIHKEASIRRIDDRQVAGEFTAGKKGDPLDPRYDLALAQYDPSIDP